MIHCYVIKCFCPFDFPRLLSAMLEMKRLTTEAITFIMLKDKEKYSYSAGKTLFDIVSVTILDKTCKNNVASFLVFFNQQNIFFVIS